MVKLLKVLTKFQLKYKKKILAEAQLMYQKVLTEVQLKHFPKRFTTSLVDLSKKPHQHPKALTIYQP